MCGYDVEESLTKKAHNKGIDLILIVCASVISFLCRLQREEEETQALVSLSHTLTG
jgi:hypothetical protein